MFRILGWFDDDGYKELDHDFQDRDDGLCYVCGRSWYAHRNNKQGTGVVGGMRVSKTLGFGSSPEFPANREMNKKYQVVVEIILRCRSCYLISLSPTNYLWWAKF